MPDHVRIRVIDDDHVVHATLNRLHDFLRHLESRHFRLHVIRRHGRRRYENAILAREWLFLHAIQEERDMRVFFRFRNVQLPEPLIAKNPRHRIHHEFRRVEHVHGQSFFILHKGRDGQIRKRFPIEKREIFFNERLRELTPAIRAEVKIEHGITVFDRRDRRTGTIRENERQHLLIEDILRVRGLNLLHRILAECFRLPEHDRVIRFLNAIPVHIAIHTPVPTANGRNMTAILHVVHHALEENGSGVLCRVAAVQECVKKSFLPNLRTLRPFDDGAKMTIRAVDATIADQADEVQFSALRHTLTNLLKLRELGEFAVLD